MPRLNREMGMVLRSALEMSAIIHTSNLFSSLVYAKTAKMSRKISVDLLRYKIELPAMQLHGGEKEGGKFQIQRAE